VSLHLVPATVTTLTRSYQDAGRVQRWAASFVALDRVDKAGEGPLVLLPSKGGRCTVVLRCVAARAVLLVRAVTERVNVQHSAERQVLDAAEEALAVLEQTGHRRRHALNVDGDVFALQDEISMRLLRVSSASGAVGLLLEVSSTSETDHIAQRLDAIEACLKYAAVGFGLGTWERERGEPDLPPSADLAIALAHYVPRRRG
jgi:hypothetical protein